MYDPATVSLIQRAPAFEGLDTERLPDELSAAFAEIAAARIRFRTFEAAEDDTSLANITRKMQRLAHANEALVSAAPNRENRAAAAFVAATAHQLVFNADQLLGLEDRSSFLHNRSISPNIAAMLLFLIAEATADAGEIARSVVWSTEDRIEQSLIAALRALAQGRLTVIVDTNLPNRRAVRRPTAAETAVAALYRKILEGVRLLAMQMLRDDAVSEVSPIGIFEKVRSLSIGKEEDLLDDGPTSPAVTFAGPFHLASLLIAVAGDLSESAVVSLPSPKGINGDEWQSSLKRIAKSRPYLWRNHREAIAKGYLEPGQSAAVGFPTGAGKSTLAELKINVTLLGDKKVVFLAPTLALVDQTAQMLRSSFPSSEVGRERADPFSFILAEEELPEILVMTPEACLAQMSFDPAVFDKVGLLVFDECHLLHPSDNPKDRRAIDAMLCVLNFARLAPDADLLLLSAMMKNTEEIAGWLKELTGRGCLALSLAWKPTRQIRGSVVYHQNDLKTLAEMLTAERRTSTTKGVPQKVKNAVGAKPLGFFSLKQTWATRSADDYALLTLLDEELLLGVNAQWWLTPNGGKVAAAIAAAAAEAGVKTLLFFQTIKNAASAVDKVAAHMTIDPIPLTDDETLLLEIVVSEMGGLEHLYLRIEDGKVLDPAAVHHGLLLPEERRLCESLYKRSNGVSVLSATSTLAQGMNLPSELVIIAEDSRFDEASNKREMLKAQELLNAAGRAGRAGQNASGMVLVVPGRVVGIDFDEKTIGTHWTTLQTIFGQSDQCLKIDDPLTAVLDRIHAGTDQTGELERYCVARLASGAGSEEEKAKDRLSKAISASFSGYRARQRADQAWLDARIEAAANFHEAEAPEETKEGSAELQISAVFGVPLEVVSALSLALATSPPPEAGIPEWRSWIFNWLSGTPDLLSKVFRPHSLEGLFGRHYKILKDDAARAAFALPKLETLCRLWMEGEPLSSLEAALGVEAKKLKTCVSARKFVIRLVPELSYLFGLPAQLLSHAAKDNDETKPVPPAADQLARCVRRGLNNLEQLALRSLMHTARLSRTQLHKHFNLVMPYLGSSKSGETWEQVLDRVEDAMMAEVNARG